MDRALSADVAEAVECGDGERVLELCAGLTEANRNELVEAIERLQARFGISSEERRDGPPPGFRLAQARAAAVAGLCVAPPSAHLLLVREVGTECAKRAILQRSRLWRDRWIDEYLRPAWAIEWPLVRALLRTGACSIPGEGYSHHMTRWVGYAEPSHRYDRDIYSELINDPDLLHEDVYRVFEVDGLVPTWSGGHDWWSEWSDALLRLEAEGRLSRPRLLDACLAGIKRPMSAATIQALTVFHGKLRPTLGELAKRHDVYLTLLESPAKPAVALGVRMLERLLKAGRLDGRAALDHLPAGWATLPRTTARRAVELAGAVLDANPALAREAIPAVLAALTHDAAEVQRAVVALLERHQAAIDSESRDQLAAAVTALDPAVRRRAGDLCGRRVSSAGQRQHAVCVGGPVEVDPAHIVRVREDDRLAPVSDLEELLELTAIVLERQDDPEQLERWCDGVSRLCNQPIPGQRAKPLLRRARRIIGRPPAIQPSTDTARAVVSIVAHHWLAGERMWTGLGAGFLALNTDAGPRAALTRRLAVLASRAEDGHAGPMLSAPTHRGGWIEPLALVERIQRGQVYDDDLAQAVLRLAPSGSAEALVALREFSGEAACVVRAALGEDLGPSVGECRLLASWDAVRVLRAPDANAVDDPLPPWSSSVRAGACCPVTLLSLPAPAHTYPGNLDLRRWLQFIWPGNREPYYAHALIVHRLTDNRWMSNAELETIGPALEPLLDPDEPFGVNAIELVAAALGAHAADRLLAAEVVIQGIATRRLDCEQLGRAIARAMTVPAAVANRWGDGLRDVAATGPLHSHELQRLLEAMFAGLGKSRPCIPKLITLLRQIAQDADERIRDPEARAWLQAIPSRTLAGAAARQALAVAGDGTDRSAAAAAEASAAERLCQGRLKTRPATPGEN